MTRKKVKLAFIVNNSSRKATFKKRKKGFLKKVHEISTLCGITAGAIIYSPYDANPEVWPSVAGMHEVISKFRALSDIDQKKHMVNHQEYMEQRIDKANKLLIKQRKDNREAGLTEMMYQCLRENMRPLHIPPRDLNDLGYLIEQFLNSLNRRIEILGGSLDMEIGESSNPVGTLPLLEGATTPAATTAAPGASFINQMYQQYQQQFYQPSDPYAGFYEQSRDQNQFMEMLNRPEQYMGYAANNQMDYTHQYHQAHHHQPPQQQFFPGESSSAPAPPASSGGGSDAPATTANPTNSIWHR